MTYTLTLCIGMFMSICGQVRTAEFPDYESCNRERREQVARVGTGYATCTPNGTLRGKQ
jgi:hypothetical protein